MSDLRNTATIDISEYNKLKNFYDTIEKEGGVVIEEYRGHGYSSFKTTVYGNAEDLKEKVKRLEERYTNQLECKEQYFNDELKKKADDLEKLEQCKKSTKKLSEIQDKNDQTILELKNKNTIKIFWILLLVFVIVLQFILL